MLYIKHSPYKRTQQFWEKAVEEEAEQDDAIVEQIVVCVYVF